MTLTVYRYKMFDVACDGWRSSRRWGTREAIEKLGGVVIDDSATCIAVSKTVDGLTEPGFDPNPLSMGFQSLGRSLTM